MLTIGSLFSGIGGIELGLEAATGGKTIWQCEIDPYASAVLKKHWPDVTRYQDIKDLKNAEKPDIICGGFPCVSISNAGKRAGIQGTGSNLWFEYARVVREIRPRFVFVENVAALTNRGLDAVLGSLSEIGYDATWDLFRASDVGASHKREKNLHPGLRPTRVSRRVTTSRHRQGQRNALTWGYGKDMANTDGAGLCGTRSAQSEGRDSYIESLGTGQELANADTERRERSRQARDGRSGSSYESSGIASHRFPPGPANWHESGWIGAQPAVRRSINGTTGKMDRSKSRARVNRLRCLGNAVVPQCAALAWTTLMERIQQK